MDLSKNTLNQFTYEANDLWKLKLGNDDYLEMDRSIRRGKEIVLRPANEASFKTSKPAFDEQFLAVVDDSGLFQLILYPSLANAFTYCSKIVFRIGNTESTGAGETAEQPGFSSDQDY